MSIVKQRSVKGSITASGLNTAIKVGPNFVFWDPSLYQGGTGGKNFPPELRDTGLRIFSLHQQVMIPGGCNIEGDGVKVSFVSRAMWTDRDLYQPENVVSEKAYVNMHLPDLAGQTVRLVVTHNGQDLPGVRWTTLNEVGGGQLLVTNLETGSYRVSLEDERDYGIEFRVAAFEMAGLIMELVDHQFDDDTSVQQLTVQLRLKTFGNQPLSEAVKLQIMAGEITIGVPVTLTPVNGAVFHTFTMDKTEGIISVTAVVVNKAALSAQVVIRGAETGQRESKMISTLSSGVQMSRLPAPGSKKVRGVYLRDAAMMSADPVEQVDGVVGNEVRLQVVAPMGMLVVRVHDKDGYHVYEFGAQQLALEGILTIPYVGPACDVALGAFVQTHQGLMPWEGTTAGIRQNDLAVTIHTLGRVIPGVPAPMQIQVEGGSGPRYVQVTVRDQRLTAATSGEDGHAQVLYGMFENKRVAGILTLGEAAARYTEYLDANKPKSMTRSGVPTRSFSNDDTYEGAVAKGGVLPTRGHGVPQAQVQGYPNEVEIQSRPLVELVAPGLEPLQGTVLCGWYRVDEFGVVELMVPMPDAIVPYSIEVFACDAVGQVAGTFKTIMATEDVVAKLYPPAFLPVGRPHLIRGTAATTTGSAVVTVNVNGRSVPFRINGTVYLPNSVVHSLGEVEFFAEPGTVILNVSEVDSDGVRTERAPKATAALISEMGNLRTKVWRSLIVMKGQTVTLNDLDTNVFYFAPGMAAALNDLTMAMAGIRDQDCCQQTADKLVAALYQALGGNSEGIALFKALHARMRSMYVQGKGFYFYPNLQIYDRHYGEIAAKRLYWLRYFVGNSRLPEELIETLGDLVDMGTNAMHAYFGNGVIFSNAMPDCASAYEVMMRHGDPVINQDAWKVVVAKIVSTETGYGVLDSLNIRVTNSVKVETEIGYAIAVAAGTGHYDEAIAWWNWLVSQFKHHGGCGYSTLNSAAAVVAAMTMDAQGIINGASQVSALVEVNGNVGDLTKVSVAQLQLWQEQGARVGVITPLDGSLVIRYQQTVELSWKELRFEIPVVVGLQTADGQPVQEVHVGDHFEVVVTLPNGYEPGLVEEIQLWPGVVCRAGGGLITMDTRDFRGKPAMKIPVVAIAPSIIDFDGTIKYVVGGFVVRDMMDAERAGSSRGSKLVILP